VSSPFFTLQRAPRFAVKAAPAAAARPRFAAELGSLVSVQADARTLLAVGAGGAGGDIAANSDGRIIIMEGLDRILHFDPAAGRLRAQAGLSVLNALRFLTERGHFLPVTPAWGPTTLGGAVATDVHGANHDGQGAFGDSVRKLRLHRTDQPPVELAPGDPSGLFEATVGGLGLTGVIEWVELETRPIRSAMMVWEAATFADLADLFALLRESQDWVYRRAWLDAARAGHGRFERFRHAQDGPLEARLPQPLLRAPGPLPRFFVNGVTAALLSGMIERRGASARRRDYASVLFPFEDAIDGFDAVFGRRGALQFQCVLPPKEAERALDACLKEIKRNDDALVLIGLTPMGPRPSTGFMSFAREGLCLTVRTRDLGERSRTFFGNLDAIVMDAGGHINPAIDARASLGMLKRGYGQLGAFEARLDPAMRSDFCRRVGTK
jgi:FAD/FMN-containing dehydrogenase